MRFSIHSSMQFINVYKCNFIKTTILRNSYGAKDHLLALTLVRIEQKTPYVFLSLFLQHSVPKGMLRGNCCYGMGNRSKHVLFFLLIKLVSSSPQVENYRKEIKLSYNYLLAKGI